jgi:hypothetical protein
MEVDELSERCQPRDARLVRSLAPINLTLGLDGPASRIIPAQEGLARAAPLASDLDSPGPEESFVKVAILVCDPCALGTT